MKQIKLKSKIKAGIEIKDVCRRLGQLPVCMGTYHVSTDSEAEELCKAEPNLPFCRLAKQEGLI